MAERRKAEPDEKEAASAEATDSSAAQRSAAKDANPAVDPTDPLAPALAAVERGDLVEAKRLAHELTTREGLDGAVKSRAENLLAQLAPDRVTIAVMVASGVLAIVLYLVYHH